jgi:hypothetical protein
MAQCCSWCKMGFLGRGSTDQHGRVFCTPDHRAALAGDTADPQGSRTGYGLSVCAALECNQKFVVEIVTLTGGNIAVGGIDGRLPEHLRGGRRHADTG